MTFSLFHVSDLFNKLKLNEAQVNLILASGHFFSDTLKF